MYFRKVELCGVNTSLLPNLSDGEKRDLLRRAQNGDADARQRLIDGNLRLVLSIVQRYAGTKNEHPDDLFQVGCIGLIKAVDRFDLSQDVRFSTYAVPMIVGEIKRYLRDNTSIRVSRSVRDLAYRALTVRDRLTRLRASEPTPDEIAAWMNDPANRTEENASLPFRPVTGAEIAEALDAIVDPVSLSDPVSSDGGGGEGLSVMDTISDGNCREENWIEEIALKEALKALPERERRIIGLRFYGCRTQTEIAYEIGISQAQVSRLEKAALERIRRRLT